MTIGKFTPQL